jgi:transcriptional regulator with XRE-family HTH domain
MELMKNGMAAWLARWIHDNDSSMRKLATRIGTSHTTISDIISGQREPTYEFCVKLATGLKLPKETILKEAGIEDPISEDATLQEIIEIARSMTPEQRRDYRKYGLFLFGKD